MFLGVKRNMKGYKLWDPENKKIVLSKHVMFDETLLLKSTVSQRVERMKTKVLTQRPSTLVLMMINSCSYVYY